VNGGALAFGIGLFVVPLLLLALGHSLRRRTQRERGVFWGGTWGYLGGIVLTCVLSLTPPVGWAGGPALRAFVVHWGMLLGAAVGAAMGAAVWGDGAPESRGHGRPSERRGARVL
jgi:hypothetical protein